MKNPSRCNFHILMAPTRDNAESAINKVKYKGEIASTECQFENLMINSEVFSKKTDARKYTKNEAPLPMKVNMQSAVNKLERFVFISFIFFNL